MCRITILPFSIQQIGDGPSRALSKGFGGDTSGGSDDSTMGGIGYNPELDVYYWPVNDLRIQVQNL